MRERDFIIKQKANDAFYLPLEVYNGVIEVLKDLSIPYDYMFSHEHKLYVEDIYKKDVFEREINSKQDSCEARYSNTLHDGQMLLAKDFEKAIEFWNLRLSQAINPENGRLMTMVDSVKYCKYFMDECIPYDKLPYNNNDTVFAPRLYLKWLRGKYVRNGQRVYCQWYESTKSTAMAIFVKAYVWCIANSYYSFYESSKKAQKGKATLGNFYDWIWERTEATRQHKYFKIDVEDIKPAKCYYLDDFTLKKVECVPYRMSKIRKRQQYIVDDNDYKPTISLGMRFTLMMLPIAIIYIALWFVLVFAVGLDPNGIIMMIYVMMPLYAILEGINPWGKGCV